MARQKGGSVHTMLTRAVVLAIAAGVRAEAGAADGGAGRTPSCFTTDVPLLVWLQVGQYVLVQFWYNKILGRL